MLPTSLVKASVSALFQLEDQRDGSYGASEQIGNIVGDQIA